MGEHATQGPQSTQRAPLAQLSSPASQDTTGSSGWAHYSGQPSPLWCMRYSNGAAMSTSTGARCYRSRGGCEGTGGCQACPPDLGNCEPCFAGIPPERAPVRRLGRALAILTMAVEVPLGRCFQQHIYPVIPITSWTRQGGQCNESSSH